MLGLLSVVWFFQNDEWIARGAFLPVCLYAIWKFEEIREIEKQGPTPLEVFRSNRGVRYWTIVCLAVQITVSFFFLLSGRDLGDYVAGFGTLMLAILVPFLPALLLSQVAMFNRLGSVTGREHR